MFIQNLIIALMIFHDYSSPQIIIIFNYMPKGGHLKENKHEKFCMFQIFISTSVRIQCTPKLFSRLLRVTCISAFTQNVYSDDLMQRQRLKHFSLY